MAEIVNINPINPLTFELQEYSTSDSSLITSFNIDTTFNPQTDYLEYFIYDLNGNILVQNISGYPGYTLSDNNVVLNPESDLRAYGYEEGQYNTVYNFLSHKLASNNFNPYFISEISSDRTEIRLDTTSIPNDLVVSSSLELINDITNSTGSYYDFYLNFGDNNLVIAVNALLDTSSINNPTVLIKLYEPLPQQFSINSQLWVVTQVSEPVAYNISITQTFDIIDNNIKLKGPNTNISVNNQINNSTSYTNYQNLSSTTSSLSQGTGSLNYQLNNILAQTGITINVDYSDYNNFIHFSSAQTRLENFYYKLQLLEEYTYSASLSSNSSSGSYYVSSSNIVWQAKINEIITTFDSYEYYLYYSSGSTCWPKTGNTPPYTNVTTTSLTGLTWFASQSAVAELYDSENNNALTLAIPSYIREDDNNAQYILFVEMVGQLFDNIFIYLQGITDKANNDNRLNYGVSKDLVADVLRDLGLKLYQNNFSSNDVYQALIGITPSGSLYNLPYTTTQLPVPTSSFLDYITTYVTASSTSSLTPTDDINKSIYKRIYNNISYLLKKKGSVEGLRALITTFGIPDTILRINEFGGKDKNVNSFDNWQDEFNYSFYTSGSSYISSSFELNSSWGATGDVPRALEFRFKTDGLPFNTASVSNVTLFEAIGLVNQQSILSLRYTGSGYTSGSYSGSIIDPYYQYALLDFVPDRNSPSVSSSIYLPFYDGGWWSVLVNTDSTTGFTLYAANKNYNGEDGNTIGFQASSSVTAAQTIWNATNTIYFGREVFLPPTLFTGSFQEIRYYSQPLTKDNFDAYVMNPYSTEQSEYLAFRATLGGELYTASVSVHPKVTGSWITTSSFASNSNFYFSGSYSWANNTEVFYFDQVPAGIQNAISDKIKQQNIILPYSSSDNNVPDANTLSPFISIQQDPSISQSYTRDIDYVEVAFSPQNEINEDINSTFGYFNIGELIGDPRFQSSSLDLYPDLNALSERYALKYESNYDWNDYIRLIKFFDNSLFKMLVDWVPARTSLAAGIVIKNPLLNRNRYRTPQVNISESIANTGSATTKANTPWTVEDQTITGSIISGFITGSNGGVMPDLFDQTSSAYTYNNTVNITQSWTGTTPSTSGSVPFTQITQEEFFNGQLSGSNLVVTTGSLNDCNVEIVQVYTTASLFSLNPLSSTNYYFSSYNLKSDKTYYVSFTVNNSGAASGTFQIRNNTGTDIQILYQSPTITSGGSLTVDKTQISYPILPLIFIPNGAGSVLDITNFTIFESYIEPDCDVLAGNAVVSRPSTLYYDVDFSSNQIIAVNEQAILDQTATPATVPDSYYTTARIINPRYKGSRTTTPNFNSLPITGSSIGQKKNVEQLGAYFVYFDWVGSANPEVKNAYNVHVKFMVDELGTVINPSDISSSYYYNLIDSFGENSTSSLTLYNSAGSTGGSTLYKIIKPGVETWPIMYTDSGSNGYYTSINFNSFPGLYTQPYETNLENASQAISSGTTVTASFSTVLLDQANGFNSTNNVYSFSFDSSVIAAISSSFDIENLGGGSTTVTVRLYKNSTQIAVDQQSISSLATNSFIITSSISPSSGSSYYVTITTSAQNILVGPSTFQIIPFISNTTISSPYFTTGSLSRNVLTSSAILGSLYGSYQQTPITNSGFNDPLLLNFVNNDEIRYEGNEGQLYLILSSSYSSTSERFYIYLDKNISSTAGINTDYFLIRRYVPNPSLVLINSTSSVVNAGNGTGFLSPQYVSSTIQRDFNNIVQNLSSKNLI